MKSPRMLAWILALLAVWVRALMHLAAEWSLNPQYRYGFVVPILALYLAWLRLHTPAALVEKGSPPPGRWLLMALALALFLLAELIMAVDAQWRIIFVLHMSAATLLTAIWLREVGGQALLRAMAFPLLFTWEGVPWPTSIELPITLGLMNAVTRLTVEFLNAAGIAALQHGNVIELSRGVVGVETACSGIQSLQSSLMVSLFLGELWRFSIRRRAALIIASTMIAFAGNLIRTAALTWIVHCDGVNELERHHDIIGSTVSGFTFLMILGSAYFLARHGAPISKTPLRPNSVFPYCGREGYAALAILASTPLLVGGWFHLQGKNARIQSEAAWRMKPSRAVQEWRVDNLQAPAESLRILGCSESESIRCRSPNGVTSQIHHFFWKPSIETPSLAVAHTPDICMPNAGWTLLQSPSPVTLKIGRKKIPVARFYFHQANVKLCVFHAIQHGGEPKVFPAIFHGMDRFWDRLGMIWEGRRNRGHETLTLIIPAMNDPMREIDAGQEALDFTFETASE